MYKISVIIPVYNAEMYLEECLQSVVHQTIIQNIEVIIINDGSTDNSQIIIDRFAAQNQNFFVYRQENKGLGATRARGLSLATGEYIAWVDADDFIATSMYEEMLLEGQGADVITCDYVFYPQKVPTKEKWFKAYQGILDWMFIERNTQPWNKIVKKSLLKRVDMAKWIDYCSDGAYALCLMKANSIVTIEKPLYFYRVGHNSMSSDYGNLPKFINNVELTRRQQDAVKSNGLWDQWKQYYSYREIYALLQLLLVSSYNNDLQTYNKTIQDLKEIQWKGNPLCRVILNYNHGIIKSFVLRRIIPISFAVSRIIVKAIM